MAATSTLFPTTVASTTGTTWTTTTNATGSGTGTTSAAWAVFTNATNGGSGGTGTINLSGYAAQAAGPASGDTIDSVVLSLRGNVAATARWTAASCTAQLFAGTTAIGSPVAIGALSTSTSNVWTVTFTGANAPTYTQLSDLRVRVTAVHTSTTSSTFNVDTAGLVVNYSTPPPPGPKIDTFVDDFATLDSAKWTSAANASVVSGSLNLATSATYEGIVSVNRYDLTGSSIYVEVPQIAVATAGSNSTVDTEFSLVLDGSNRLTFVKEATTLFLQRQVAGTGTDVAIPTYDATAMRWWRIAESGGTVTWSTSPDGTTWTSRGTWVAAGLDLTAFQVRLITGFYGTTTAAAAAIIDNLNTTGAAPPSQGSATGTTTSTGSAAGARTPKATGTGTTTATGAAIGAVPKRGTATGTVTATGSAAGKRVAKATTAGTVTATGAATAATIRRGTATGTATSTGSAAGKRTPKATATGVVTTTGAATGRRAPKATTTGTVTVTGSAVGSAPLVGVNDGTATGTTTTTGTATGRRQPRASSAGTTTTTGTATGKRTPKAAATGTVTVTGSAVGAAPAVGLRTGTATGVVTLTGTAAGRRFAKALTLGTVTVTGVAVGSNGGAPIVPPVISVGEGRSPTISATGSSPFALSRLGADRELAAVGRSRTLTLDPWE